MTYTEKVLADLKAKNPDQPEFIQAATEVLDALAPVVNNDPKYQKTSLLERLVEPERQIMHAILEGRQNCNLTQEQLAQVTGIDQANISRLENGTANPSLRTLKRLAAGMGMALKVEFVPIQP